MNQFAQQKMVCIFGLGMSGVSAARYFNRIGQSFFVVDTRKNPPGKNEVTSLEYCAQSFFEKVPNNYYEQASLIVLSPGISPAIALIQAAKTQGVKVVGDVEVFLQNSQAEIIAITGSNGKSTVTDLTYRLLEAAGEDVAIGGNIGVPVLDYLPNDDHALYVLELSSFQLDTTESLKAKVAVVLNISEDHMDRYSSFEVYRASKLSIFERSHCQILNADDENLLSVELPNAIRFSASDNRQNYYLTQQVDDTWLMRGSEKIIAASALQLKGTHNLCNALVAIAICEQLKIKLSSSVMQCLKSYRGLSHRFEIVHHSENCDWVDDSKATNVGATLAAINSVDKCYKNIVLIAGGDAKGADLTPLKEALDRRVNLLILIGKDANKIADISQKSIKKFAHSMEEAVQVANQFILENQASRSIVLLSPACASIDMFTSFVQRGEAFSAAVRKCA